MTREQGLYSIDAEVLYPTARKNACFLTPQATFGMYTRPQIIKLQT